MTVGEAQTVAEEYKQAMQDWAQIDSVTKAGGRTPGISIIFAEAMIEV